jgi:hypothetical protein
MNSPAWRSAQVACTGRSMAEFERRHHASDAEVAAATGARELWIDLLAVLFPVTVLFLAASRFIVARLVAEYEREDRAVAAVLLAVLAPLGAGAAVALAQSWGMLVEELRLRSDHISSRAFELPANRHGWLLWGVAMAFFVAVGGVELLRKRDTTHRPRRAIG